MALEVWIAFAVASMVLLVIPGPTILLVVSYALGHGRRTAVATATGVVFGDFLAMTASILGLGALLAASADLYGILRLIGGAYLVYLGIRLWRAPVGDDPIADNDNLPEESPLRILFHAFAVTALNPKSIVFFVAFVPQFIDPNAALLPQVVVMEATFLVLAGLNAIGYALIADKARSYIRRKAVRRAVNRTGGTLLIAAGAVTAGYRKIAA
ncbi:LysE family translocator [Rhizobium halophytocola]|uniref:Threonine/homoserine/homoserine lactone efflux protein n=1 Tax=Rhizobium halophytocola TaxID=735519 RepID=A0ABS4E352_9HYPH|nr:LysE family translocator [Rhizobium halophytocola]MBP1852351.1 threonine/homoserine/homoserine lactone efflux protein [Rhizobium halophytocola]